MLPTTWMALGGKVAQRTSPEAEQVPSPRDAGMLRTAGGHLRLTSEVWQEPFRLFSTERGRLLYIRAGSRNSTLDGQKFSWAQSRSEKK